MDPVYKEEEESFKVISNLKCVSLFQFPRILVLNRSLYKSILHYRIIEKHNSSDNLLCLLLQAWYAKTPLGKKRAKAAQGDEEDGGGGKGGKGGKGKKGGKKGKKGKKKK